MDTLKLTFRDRAQVILNRDEYFFAVASLSLILSIWKGSPGYLIGISAVMIMLWANRWNWIIIGLRKAKLISSIVKAFIYSIGIFILIDIITQPIIEGVFGQVDISSLNGLRGNFISYVFFIVFMWIVAAFGEEFFYRGFIMKRLSQILGDTTKTWRIGALISAVFFGLAHMYQGPSGMITTGMIGFILGLIFMKERTLIVPILVHGIYDMIGITLIYLGKDRIFIDWITNLVA
ncbi:CPBP family intramembrane glutamic endopeptidase [Fulvivirga lutimaris]|uniref:CPBP family intramembrane glutamic endopeptidase n=1 Tax=Fulvivirga lutimaris TaxID=1819566 RepID=UPI0012BB706B|nr:CPBP family intramembrane glutamic endopeptidase [Fulvivirga lutimaris]MTI40895.1 CPBP family intramembrane metalloprotease [Fulvivirga lutimaris]